MLYSFTDSKCLYSQVHPVTEGSNDVTHAAQVIQETSEGAYMDIWIPLSHSLSLTL